MNPTTSTSGIEEVYDKDCLRKFKETVIDPAWREFENTFCQYYQACTIDANTPEYRKYRFEWKATPGNAPYVPPDPKTRDKVVLGCVCHQSRSYRDFSRVVYGQDGAISVRQRRRFPCTATRIAAGIPGAPTRCTAAPPTGHYPVLANRELAKRVYIMFKSINPLNQIYLHTGGQSAMNMCAFST